MEKIKKLFNEIEECKRELNKTLKIKLNNIESMFKGKHIVWYYALTKTYIYKGIIFSIEWDKDEMSNFDYEIILHSKLGYSFHNFCINSRFFNKEPRSILIFDTEAEAKLFVEVGE